MSPESPASASAQSAARSAHRPREGRRAVGVVTSCCVWIVALLVFIFSLVTTSRISYWLGGGRCHYVYYCCSDPCTSYCRTTECYAGGWFSTRPITEDELPPPAQIVGNSTYFSGEGGNGENDYWSLVVAAAAGSVGSFLVMLATCAPCMSLSPREACMGPLLTGVLVFIGLLLHVATTVCLGIQFWSTYSDGQWVYNYFRNPQYEYIDGSLIDYLLNDNYYDWFATWVLTLYILLYIAGAAELFYLLLLFLAPSEYSYLHNVYVTSRYYVTHALPRHAKISGEDADGPTTTARTSTADGGARGIAMP